MDIPTYSQGDSGNYVPGAVMIDVASGNGHSSVTEDATTYSLEELTTLVNKENSLYNKNERENTTAQDEKDVRTKVRLSICPKVKFLSDSPEAYRKPRFAIVEKNAQAPIICKRVLVYLRGKQTDQTWQTCLKFWLTYRNVIKKEIQRVRNYCCSEVRRKLMSGELLCNV